jgi:hypothetical protein
MYFLKLFLPILAVYVSLKMVLHRPKRVGVLQLRSFGMCRRGSAPDVSGEPVAFFFKRDLASSHKNRVTALKIRVSVFMNKYALRFIKSHNLVRVAQTRAASLQGH